VSTGGGRTAGKRRRRFSAAEAQERILDAAAARLALAGPEALRLTDVAKDLGITHQAILHHFDSRGRLLREVARRTMERLRDELVEVLGREGDEPLDPGQILDRVFDTFGRSGQARLMAWMALSGQMEGQGGSDEPVGLARSIATVLHERRRQWGMGDDFEHSLFIVMLAAVVAFGDALTGDAMRRSAGLEGDPDAAKRFRDWITRVIVGQVIESERSDSDPS
jgi:AcrR family transcriptional regulator